MQIHEPGIIISKIHSPELYLSLSHDLLSGYDLKLEPQEKCPAFWILLGLFVHSPFYMINLQEYSGKNMSSWNKVRKDYLTKRAYFFTVLFKSHGGASLPGQ